MITIVFFLSGLFTYLQTKNILIRNTQTVLQTINSSITEQFDEQLRNNVSLVRQMAANPVLIEFLKDVKTHDQILSNPMYPELNSFLDTIQKTNSSISVAWFASEEGSYFVLNGNTISSPDYNIKSRPWHTDALMGSEVSFSKPYIDVVTGQLSIDTLAKVIVDDNVIGFTAVSMFINFLPSVMSKYSVGQTGYTFLMDHDGTILFHPNHDLVMKSWRLHFGQSDLSNMQQMSLVNINGRNEYIVASPVPITNWFVGSAMPEAEALEHLKSFTQTSLLFLFGAGLVLVLLVSALLNYMLRNIPLLIKQLNTLAEGALSIENTLDSPDELGRIARAIYTMSHKIQSNMKVIHESAYYDALTKLPNRRYLSERLASVLQESKQKNEKAALFFIDLDNFKILNDTRGHKVGDELLCQVGARLKLDNHDGLTVFRFGGDEFVIILERIKNRQEVQECAEQLRAVFTSPFELFNQLYYVNYSAGIVIFPDDGTSEEELLKNSDTAMYRAKSLGKNTVQFFNIEMVTTLVEKENMIYALRQAVDNQSFTIDYQAQIDIQNNRLHGFEALIRWKHPELGEVPAEQFIPLAEELGLIIPIEEWILSEACKTCASLQSAHPITMSVNISTLQMRSPMFISTVIQTLQKSGLPPHLLVIEITEDMVIECFDQSMKTLQQLRALGIRIALDDFGTGYSSFIYLKNLPIDILKMDKSLIQDLKSGEIQKTNIVESIIHLVKNLGIEVAVEGVETKEQLEILHAWGCDYVQGYNNPIPIEHMTQLQFHLKDLQVEK